jgi:hypothetical protein
VLERCGEEGTRSSMDVDGEGVGGIKGSRRGIDGIERVWEMHKNVGET